MLPIRSVADTYRAAFWALRRNAAVCCAWVVLFGGYEELVELWRDRFDPGLVGGWMAVVLTVSWVAVGSVLTATLVVPLHAAFLSDGRVSGFRALANGTVVCRVAWRGFLIVVATAIPAGLLFVLAVMLLGGAVMRAVAAADDGAPGSGLLFGVHVIDGVLLGLATILLGLGIPRTVALGRGGPLSGSVRWGARQFWRMAGRMAAGPGAVGISVLFVQLRVLNEFDGAYRPLLPFLHVSISALIGLVVFVAVAAMIAGILSDDYRWALAQGRPV